MMGRLKGDQGQLFYEFHLDAGVPADHWVREIDAVQRRSQSRWWMAAMRTLLTFGAFRRPAVGAAT